MGEVDAGGKEKGGGEEGEGIVDCLMKCVPCLLSPLPPPVSLVFSVFGCSDPQKRHPPISIATHQSSQKKTSTYRSQPPTQMHNRSPTRPRRAARASLITSLAGPKWCQVLALSAAVAALVLLWLSWFYEFSVSASLPSQSFGAVTSDFALLSGLRAGLGANFGPSTSSSSTEDMASHIPKKVYVTDKDDPRLGDNPNWDGFEVVYFDDGALDDSMRALSRLLELEVGVKDAYRAFEELIPMAYKVDLWRYCLLWANGGTCGF